MIYLFLLKEEFWIAENHLRLDHILPRVKDLFLLEFTYMLDWTHLPGEGVLDQTITWRTFADLTLYALGFYILVRRLFTRGRNAGRVGAAYFLGLFACIVFVHILTPRAISFQSPRFLTPAFASLAVMLGLAADQIEQVLADSVRLSPGAASATAWTAMAIATLVFWGPYWSGTKTEPMAWPSGHRRITRDIVEALNRHGVRRVLFNPGTENVLLGYELQFASALRIRANRGTLGDRLERRVDEAAYGGPRFSVYRLRDGQRRADDAEGLKKLNSQLEPGGFWLGRMYFYVPGEPRARRQEAPVSESDLIMDLKSRIPDNNDSNRKKDQAHDPTAND